MTNNRPIIGILAQETTKQMKNEFEEAESYIAASYVKAIEGSGARVVPIFLDQSEGYYRNLVKSINGLLLPGGNTWFYEEDNKTPKRYGYVRAAELLYEEAKKINEAGTVFPILGICLGFEVLLFLDEDKKEFREQFKLIQTALPVNFLNDCCEKSFWKECPNLSERLVCYFSHQFYVTEEKMRTDNLKDKWTIVATTHESKQNVTFVSIIESKKYPIIGLQFHPEKNVYEWKTKFSVPHDEFAIASTRYFFDCLVRLSKSNNNKFTTEEEETRNLISQYPKSLTSEKISFDELYLFDKNSVPILFMSTFCLIK